MKLLMITVQMTHCVKVPYITIQATLRVAVQYNIMYGTNWTNADIKMEQWSNGAMEQWSNGDIET